MKVEILFLIKNSCRGGNIRKFSSISYVGDQTYLKGCFLADLDLAENLDLPVCISCVKILHLSVVALAALPKSRMTSQRKSIHPGMTVNSREYWSFHK